MDKQEAQIVINLDASQPINELGVLENRYKELKQRLAEAKAAPKEIKQLEKSQKLGEEEAQFNPDFDFKKHEQDAERLKFLKSENNDLKAITAELQKTEDAYKKLRAELGLQGMTMSQLRREAKDLNSQISNTLNPESKNILDKQLAEVTVELNKQNQKLKESKEAWALLSNGARLETIISETERASRSIKVLRDTEKLLIEQLESGKLSNEKQINYQNELKETQKQLNKLTIDAKKADEQLDRTKEFEGFEKMRKSTKLAAMSINELERYLQLANEKLKDMDRGSEAFKKLRREVNLANAEIDQHTRKVKFNLITYMKAEGLDSSFKSVIGDIALKAFYLPFELFAKGVEKLKLLSDQLTSIEKKAGMSKKEVANLNEELQKTSTRTTQDELLKIAEIGGAMGVAKDQLAGFTVETNKINVALGEEFGSVEEVTKSLGILKNVFKETKDLQYGDAMSRVGSSINELSNIGSATAPNMAKFAQNVGALGQLGGSVQNLLAFGAFFQDLGVDVDKASGGLTNLMLQANKHKELYLAQINSTRKGIKMTSQEFKDLYNTDPNKLLMELAKSFEGLKPDQVASGLQKMKVGTQESIAVMGALSNNIDMANRYMDTSNKAFKENISITNEAAKMEENFAGQLAKAGKEFDKAGMTIMNAFLPSLLALLKGFFTFIEVLKALPKFLNDYKGTILVLIVSIVAFNHASIAASLASLRFAARLRLLRAATLANVRAFKLLTKAMIGNTFIAVAVVLVALGVAFYETYQRSQALRANVAGIINVFKAFGDVLVGVKDLVKAFFSFDNISIENAKQKLDELGEKFKNAFKAGKDELLMTEWIAEGKKTDKKKKENETTYKSEAELKGTKTMTADNINIPDSPDKDEKGKKKSEKAQSDHEKFLKQIHEHSQEIFGIQKDFDAQFQTENEKQLGEIDKKFLAILDKNASMQDEIKKSDKLTAQQKIDLTKDLHEKIMQITEQWATESAQMEAKQARKAFEDALKAEVEFAEAKSDLEYELDLERMNVEERQTIEKVSAMEQRYEDLRLLAEKYGQEMIDYEDFMLQKIIENFYPAEEAQKTAEQKAIDAEKNKYEKLKILYKDNHKILESIEKAHLAKMLLLDKQSNEKRLQAYQNFGSEFANMLGALNSFIAQEGGQMSNFQKSLGIAQIAIETGVALSTIITKATASGVTPIDIAVQVAAGVGLILTNMAKATAIINTAQVNQVYQQKKAEFASGGKTDSIISGNTSHADGGLPIIDPKTGQKIAEIESGEMILSRKTVANNPFLVNELLKSSMFDNGKSILPKIQASFKPSQAVSSRFENGGIFGNLQTNQNSSLDLSPILQQYEQMANVMAQIAEKMGQPSEAFITYKNLDKSLGEMKDIKKQADIFNL